MGREKEDLARQDHLDRAGTYWINSTVRLFITGLAAQVIL